MFDFGQPVVPGVSFAVDLGTLIEEIHISPTAPDWFADLVKNVCSQYGPKAPVEQSRLAGSPVFSLDENADTD